MSSKDIIQSGTVQLKRKTFYSKRYLQLFSYGILQYKKNPGDEEYRGCYSIRHFSIKNNPKELQIVLEEQISNDNKKKKSELTTLKLKFSEFKKYKEWVVAFDQAYEQIFNPQISQTQKQNLEQQEKQQLQQTQVVENSFTQSYEKSDLKQSQNSKLRYNDLEEEQKIQEEEQEPPRQTSEFNTNSYPTNQQQLNSPPQSMNPPPSNNNPTNTPQNNVEINLEEGLQAIQNKFFPQGKDTQKLVKIQNLDDLPFQDELILSNTIKTDIDESLLSKAESDEDQKELENLKQLTFKFLQDFNPGYFTLTSSRGMRLYTQRRQHAIASKILEQATEKGFIALYTAIVLLILYVLYIIHYYTQSPALVVPLAVPAFLQLIPIIDFISKKRKSIIEPFVIKFAKAENRRKELYTKDNKPNEVMQIGDCYRIWGKKVFQININDLLVVLKNKDVSHILNPHMIIDEEEFNNRVIFSCYWLVGKDKSIGSWSNSSKYPHGKNHYFLQDIFKHVQKDKDSNKEKTFVYVVQYKKSYGRNEGDVEISIKRIIKLEQLGPNIVYAQYFTEGKWLNYQKLYLDNPNRNPKLQNVKYFDEWLEKHEHINYPFILRNIPKTVKLEQENLESYLCKYQKDLIEEEQKIEEKKLREWCEEWNIKAGQNYNPNFNNNNNYNDLPDGIRQLNQAIDTGIQIKKNIDRANQAADVIDKTVKVAKGLNFLKKIL